jgi:hypothetical protein
MSAIETLRRAMKRHEKRARSMGLPGVAERVRMMRAGLLRVAPSTPRDLAAAYRSIVSAPPPALRRDLVRRAAWIYERAADAMAKFEAAQRLAEETEEYPYVCPGCHRVNAPCAPGCIDAEMEQEREDSDHYWAEDDTENEDDRDDDWSSE